MSFFRPFNVGRVGQVVVLSDLSAGYSRARAPARVLRGQAPPSLARAPCRALPPARRPRMLGRGGRAWQMPHCLPCPQVTNTPFLTTDVTK